MRTVLVIVLLVGSASDLAFGALRYDTSFKAASSFWIRIESDEGGTWQEKYRYNYTTGANGLKAWEWTPAGGSLGQVFGHHPSSGSIDWTGAPAGVQDVWDECRSTGFGANNTDLDDWLSSGGDWDDFNPGGGGANGFPIISINTPSDGSDFALDALITFGGTATDPEDGDISTDIEWTSSRDGFLGQFASGTMLSPLSEGTHLITAQVADSAGGVSSDSITIEVSDDGDGGSQDNDYDNVEIAPPACYTTFKTEFDEAAEATFIGEIDDATKGDEFQTAELSFHLLGVDYDIPFGLVPDDSEPIGAFMADFASILRGGLQLWFTYILAKSVFSSLRRW